MPPSELVEKWLEWGVVNVPDPTEVGHERWSAFVDRHSSRKIYLPDPDLPPPRVAYSWMSSRRFKWNYDLGVFETPGYDGSTWRWVRQGSGFDWRAVKGA